MTSATTEKYLGILACADGDSLELLAETADKINGEHAARGRGGILGVHRRGRTEEAIGLTANVATLIPAVNVLRSRGRSQTRSMDTLGNGRSGNHTPRSTLNSVVCLYYRKFADQATKCTSRCIFLAIPKKNWVHWRVPRRLLELQQYIALLCTPQRQFSPFPGPTSYFPSS